MPRKLAKQITAGDILVFVQEGKREEDDLTFRYKVTSVTEAVGGPLFNPQTIIDLTTLDLETNEQGTMQFHPEQDLWLE
jgi:hypothetical protein